MPSFKILILIKLIRTQGPLKLSYLDFSSIFSMIFLFFVLSIYIIFILYILFEIQVILHLLIPYYCRKSLGLIKTQYFALKYPYLLFDVIV